MVKLIRKIKSSLSRSKQDKLLKSIDRYNQVAIISIEKKLDQL